MNGLEEERRLAYVGLTRARRRAFVSFAANRRIHGQWQSAARSRFVDELPDEHIEIVDRAGARRRASLGNAAWAARGRLVRRTAAGVSPGWGADWDKAQAARRPLLIESAAAPRRGQEIQRVGGFAVGDRVFHQKFGYGTVRAVEDNKLAIDFEEAGDKKVMDAFVERA